jgi:hypothetical protein
MLLSDCRIFVNYCHIAIIAKITRISITRLPILAITNLARWLAADC